MIASLAWVGDRAQWVLALGILAALLVPGPGALLHGTVPFWVTLLFGLAMVRIDLFEVVRKAVRPTRLIRNLGLCAFLMVLLPTLFWFVAREIGLSQAQINALVYTSAAPPLGSGAAFCLMLGFNAAFALEITVLASLITPITMPIVTRLLLGEAVPLDAIEMTGRLALLIGLGSAGAVLARWAFGEARIERHGRSFDGVAAIILVIFLFPLFDGLMHTMLTVPMLAIGTLALAFAANLGTQILCLPVCRRIAGDQIGGATALMAGNRNAALTLATLPPDPFFTLYVTLYQFPLYLTPLVLRRIVGELR